MNRLQALAASLTLLTSGAANAAVVQLIANGGFETGDFTGWTATDLPDGSGSWFVTGASAGPISGLSTAGPASGAFYAVTDQSGPGTHALAQTFLVPLGATSVIVYFDMFMNDSSGLGPLDLGLDHLAGANQHTRVDIMSVAAGAFSTAPADIIAALVSPSTDGPAVPYPYTSYAFDITSAVTPGGSYTLRFGEVDNQLFFNTGVDNVRVLAESGVPAPAAFWLLGVALLGLGIARRV